MNPVSQNRRSPKGFSLIELMIVIAIMLLLAALAMPRLLDAQKKAYETGTVSFLRTLQSDQESYRLANGAYSDNFTDLGLAALEPGPLEDFFAPHVASPILAEQFHVGVRPAPLLAVIFPASGLFSLTTGLPEEQTPQETPPPKKRFGSKRQTQTGPASSAPVTPSVPGGTPVAPKRPPRGGIGESTSGAPPAGTGTPSGGFPPSSGGTGGTGTGAGTGATGAPQGSGGSSAPFAPTPATATKTNIVLNHNYIFRLRRPTLTTWSCSVAPIRDRGESKFFFIDQTGVIRSELGKPASETSPQM